MTRLRIFLGILIAAGVCLTMASTPAAQRMAGRERSMYVSVVDQNGVPVPDVTTTDLVIREDNVAREILRVQPAVEPMQIAFLVDTSQAAREHIQHLRQALPTFATEMTQPNASGRKNEIAIIGIGERPTILAEYSSDPAQIRKGIDRIWAMPNSGMYFLDAIIEAAQGFKKRETTRPVIIAIATSGPEYSSRHHDQAIDPMKSSGAAFYALLLGQPDTSTDFEARERATVVDTGTRVTGGYQEQLLTSMAIAPKLKTLADQLKHQYRVTYGRPESLIPPERITVAAVKPGITARGTPVVNEAQGRP